MRGITKRMIAFGLSLLCLMGSIPTVVRAEDRKVTIGGIEVFEELEPYIGNGRGDVVKLPKSAFRGAGDQVRVKAGRMDFYGSWATNEFSVATPEGNFVGFCAEPNSGTPNGVYQASILNNDFIKWCLIKYQSEPQTFNLGQSYYSAAHAIIGYAYTGQTTGLNQGQIQAMQNFLNHPQIQQDLRDGVCRTSVNGVPMELKLSDYEAYVAINPLQDIVWVQEKPKGMLQLKKESTKKEMTDDNVCYSLAGAVYKVYQGNTEVGEFVTDEAGNTTPLTLKPADYVVQEVQAPKGYQLDHNRYAVKVLAGKTVFVNGGVVKDVPLNDPVEIWLGKIDAETTERMPQGSASLEGAKFEILYYKGHYEGNPKEVGVVPERRWILKTNAEGYVMPREEYLVEGDEFYRSETGKVTFPLGTITIQEIEAPKGYLLGDNKVFVRKISQDGFADNVETYDMPIVEETIIRGGVKIAKWDLELQKGQSQGEGTLEGAKFDLINRNKHAVKVEERLVPAGEVIATLETGKDGVVATASNYLPYGTYEVKEVEAPEGYLKEGVISRSFSIKEEGKVVDLTKKGTTIQNQVIRGDLEGVKIEAGSHKRMKGVAFSLTSKTTGEKHILMTDENGYFSTASSWNKHSYKTNEGTPKAGVWFGEGEVNDKVGALPYDTYILDEIKGEGNKGKEMIKGVEVVIRKDKTVVQLGTLTNHPEKVNKMKIHTTALNQWDGKEIEAKPNQKFKDVVKFWGHSYLDKKVTFKAILMNPKTGKPFLIDGKVVESKKEVLIESSEGQVIMDFEVNATGLAGKDFVIYEYVYDEEGNLIVSEENPTNKDQTLHITDKPVRAPKTGDTKSLPIAMGGVLSALSMGAYVWKKKKEEIIP